ncbi:hypothetical protein [Roseiconus lacunae]|uniref:Uncharacterized protein n=1 Tax=Roseiconus lacunae TaxID=2605694 RepID=A0ABT7PL72_9BACT|nr:hypothetical protein [Roseiconus lacunae]MDM4017259.1 hypothetical protein [Roseiconus lacunae]
MVRLSQRMQQLFASAEGHSRLTNGVADQGTEQPWENLLVSCAELLNLTSSLGIHVNRPIHVSPQEPSFSSGENARTADRKERTAS